MKKDKIYNKNRAETIAGNIAQSHALCSRVINYVRQQIGTGKLKSVSGQATYDMNSLNQSELKYVVSILSKDGISFKIVKTPAALNLDGYSMYYAAIGV